MKFVGIGLGVALLVFAFVAAAQAPDLASMDIVMKSVPDGPVARVNGVSIDAREFRGLYRSEIERWAQMNQQKAVPDNVRIGMAIAALRSLIMQEILRQEAAKRKVSVSEEDLQKAYAAEMDSMKKALGQDGKPLTEAEVLQRAGTTKEEALADLRKGLMIHKVREALVKEANVTVSDKDIAGFFEANKDKFPQGGGVHLKQIFIKTVPARGDAGVANRNQARDKANTAAQRIRAGQSFESVAKDVSEGQGKESGGDIGTIPLRELPPFLGEAAAKLQPGQMSDVIESDYGFHLIKLVESFPGEAPTLEKMGPAIKRELLEEKSEEIVQRFCAPIIENEGAVQEFLIPQLTRQMNARPDLLRQLEKSAQGGAGRPDGSASGAPKTAPSSAGETRTK
ncbi:MAG TPA: peptidylprolyl isomerase [Candidatus Hydrogenedentes bacterium]|nr:peptidylprolyl isomerase [Candidatus Hydrogenedentota bacterium]HOS01776.1 peptidylprolyl isomerase [Candidatus Hydrogenedentota bacterium]